MFKPIDERYFLYLEDVDLGLSVADAGYQCVVARDAAATQTTGTQPVYFEARNTVLLWLKRRRPVLTLATVLRLIAKVLLHRDSASLVPVLRGIADAVTGRLWKSPKRHRPWEV